MPDMWWTIVIDQEETKGMDAGNQKVISIMLFNVLCIEQILLVHIKQILITVYTILGKCLEK